jgi:23S rRNA pseudouridine1911/1915/1917 synthase
VGDPVYARTPQRLRPLITRLGFHRQALHAAVLGFAHPISGERVSFHAATPVDLGELIVELRGSM